MRHSASVSYFFIISKKEDKANGDLVGREKSKCMEEK
jgi:hypothetical protein